jgi:hypothetical protein
VLDRLAKGAAVLREVRDVDRAGGDAGQDWDA